MSFVTLEQKGPVGIITMNRPDALNALNEQVLRDLDAVLDRCPPSLPWRPRNSALTAMGSF